MNPLEPRDAEGRPVAPEIVAAWVRAALDSYLRQRAPDQRVAFWRAVALGYGGKPDEPDATGCFDSTSPRDAKS